MKSDGKNRFYKTLNLDKETKKLLGWYTKLIKKMMQESENQNYEQKDEK